MESFFATLNKLLETERAEREERKSLGKSFNVFQVLGLSRSEVRLHSAFIAELLKPDGSHGLGAAPLKSFLSIVVPDLPFPFDAERANVKVEHFIGSISPDGESGGQIDILVQSGNCAIIIENKIDAGDQFKQLVRYDEYGRRYKGGHVLLYLTLFGHAASEYSTQSDKRELEDGSDYQRVSYRDEILLWLSACLDIASDKAPVRETILQYQNLIKQLTNDMAPSCKKALVEEMIKHHQDVADLWAAQDEYVRTVLPIYLKRAIMNLCEELGLEINEEKGFFDGIAKKKLFLYKKEWKNAAIALDTTSHHNLWIYITGRSGRLNVEKESFSSLNEKQNADWPFGWSWMRDGYWDLFSPRTISAIISGAFISVLKGHIQQILADVDNSSNKVNL